MSPEIRQASAIDPPVSTRGEVEVVQPEWELTSLDDKLVLKLLGDWTVHCRLSGIPERAAAQIHLQPGQRLQIDSSSTTRWDSALPGFLLTLSELGQRQGWQLDDSRLPPNLQRLLRLAGDAALAPSTRGPEPSRRLFSRIGVATLRHAQGVNAGTTLLGETVLALGRLLRGRAVWYKADAWALLQTCGADALPIVSLVNALVGAIIAFVGSIQLQQFGAGILLADGVTIATVREMAAVITAVVLAGRTGAAFAAHIATMQGNEEIDALKVMGVPPVEFLVLPRVLALTMMMPLLYFYACVMGILGGLIVGTGMMDLSAITYFDRSLDALSTQSIVLAVLKSLAFGALIALCSCYYGLRAGRNAAAVGEATTSAVVAGIVGVISLDAVFDVCAHALGI